MIQDQTFGQALEAVQQGKLIAREGWNGKGMFVFQRPADVIPISMVVDQIKTIPASVKKWFTEHGDQEAILFGAYLCMKAADGSIVNGWLASQTDMLAQDWCILEY